MSEEAHPAIADLSETEFAPLLKIGGANRADLLENTNLGLLFHLGYEFPARLARLRDYLRSNGVMERDLKDLDKRIATANKSQRARAAEKKRKAGLGDDFERNDKGSVIRSAPNIRLALTKLGVELSMDVFAYKAVATGWKWGADKVVVEDDVLSDIWVAIDDSFGFVPPKDQFKTVVFEAARRNSFHPVKDYLESLRWDGVPRLSSLLQKYVGADDTPFYRAVGRIFLIAAVARIYEPGCKFDEMLLLCGDQGLQKSGLPRMLVPNPDWFTDSMPLHETDQKIIEVTRGKWIVEISDLKGESKAEANDVKAMLSSQKEIARLAYAMVASEVLRSFVISGTTNLLDPMIDPTGNRRFWPVMCRAVIDMGGTGKLNSIDLPGIVQDRDQLWAEAMFEYGMGASIRLDPKLYEEARLVQKKFTKENPFTEVLSHYLDKYEEGYIASVDVWTLLRIPVERHKPSSSAMGNAMAELGWVRDRLRKVKGVDPKYLYFKGTSTRRIVVTQDLGSSHFTTQYADTIVEPKDDDDL